MEFINNNGLLQVRDLPLFKADHRLLRYGDGLFESIRMFEGQLPFLEAHVQRLLKGMQLLGFHIPDTYNSTFFLFEIRKLVGFSANARIRLQVYRNTEGYYLPDTDEPAFFISSDPLESGQFKLPRKGLTIGVFPDWKMATHSLSNLKTCNSLLFVLAAKFAKAQELDEALLLNHKGNIAEAGNANIFICKNNQLITPALTEGCVAGVLRAEIIRLAPILGLFVTTSRIRPADLSTADEVWLTNSVQGIRWVKNHKSTTFGSTLAKKMTVLLNQSVYE